jgi:phosphoenolpyruvate carboxylase
MDMVLAKTDLAIASRYAELVADAELRERIFERIKAEWELTRQHLLAILEQDDFLADNPLLKRSLQLRSPYMDPLNHLQVELLKRHRAGETDERVARGIHLSINGIASGIAQQRLKCAHAKSHQTHRILRLRRHRPDR